MNTRSPRHSLAIIAAGAALFAGVSAPAAMLTSAQDTTFVTQAAQGGMSEVADAKLAQTHGSSSAVKSFAAKMIADHTKANAQLAAIAKKDGYTLPTSVGPENAQMKTAMAGLHGKAFDTSYLQGQVQGHETMEQVMEKEIASGKNADLVAFAKATLPTVKEHLSLAKSDVGGPSATMSTPAANTSPMPHSTST